ncbi:MAG TPA: ATP-binding protein [Phycisphaerales bacterium]|nr:ATP-binding protein [Phycisphaerales bacterium]
MSTPTNATPAHSTRASSEPHLRIELRSNPLLLSGVRELIVALSRRLGFSDESGGQIALAVDEALCNVIRHGYQRRPDRPIWLSIWAEGGAWVDGGAPTSTGSAGGERPDALRIVIEDEAKQVSPETIKSRSLEEIRPGGLGVHIIQTVMDEARYEKRGTTGMRLTMVKKRVGSVGDGARAAGNCGCSGAGAPRKGACHE